MPTRSNRFAYAKFGLCLRLARDCSRDYRLTGDRRYLTIKRESMTDARYWRSQIQETT